ncbi:MAG: hydrogen gas-evolving membrane-bound hydrogenase subunit E [Acidimicrobiales bacterium]
MIWALLGAHLLGCIVIALAGARLGRLSFLVAAVPTSATAVWGATRLGADDVATAEYDWVSGLDLAIGFQVDQVAAVMTLLVSGIGALVFIYAAGYFGPDAKGLGRFAATLLAFSTAMLGLVWAETVWSLFLFWELTSITSFLLVGFKSYDPAATTAARRALVLTVAGGLALMGGLVLLVDETGTAYISQMEPISGTAASVVAICVMAGAATKSAQFPFHVWLPGAMAAPTPVSAYLHSATMVKAGVLLVGILAPALSDASLWKPIGVTLGLVSMLWGAIGALRHVDAKLILAWGTVSQLGLLIALFSMGSGKATFAATSILVAHAVFKAALFMVVGEIDVRTGTRDVTKLSGLRRSMPVAFWVAVISGASMAGIPPLLGFPAKEAAVEAVLGFSGFERVVLSAGVMGGSVLTVAYTLRFLIGVFGDSGEATEVAPRRPLMTAPPVLLAAISLGGFALLGAINEIVIPAATELNAKSDVYELKRWPGFTDAFIASVIIVALGVALGLLLARRLTPESVPRPLGARVADGGIDGIVKVSRRVAATVQHGSLPVYVATMATIAAIAATPFLWSIDFGDLVWTDSPAQLAVAAAVVAASFVTIFLGSRLGAALALGAVGLAVTGIFVAHGAPDLALTQLLVEMVVVVGFVVGLGHLNRSFPPAGRVWRGVRMVAGLLVGGAVTVGLTSAAYAPTGEPPIGELVAQGADEGGGNNIVNVILTDIRALDTLGEILVLAVVAIGMIALVQAGRHETVEERTS